MYFVHVSKVPGFDPWVWKMPWRREMLPTPVFWPGEFHGLYSPRGHKESNRTEQLSLSLSNTDLSMEWSQSLLLSLCQWSLSFWSKPEPTQCSYKYKKLRERFSAFYGRVTTSSLEFQFISSSLLQKPLIMLKNNLRFTHLFFYYFQVCCHN